MEQCWENWPLHTEQEQEIDHEQDDYGDSLLLLEEWQQQKPPDDDDDNFLREILQMPTPDLEGKRAAALSRTFILSFDNSAIIPAAAIADQQQQPPKKRQQQARKKEQEGAAAKKSRNDSQSLDHIMSERKRRQQLTQMFIALSATIPGLKKTDKASILGEAINYVKQLQERVRELEKRNKERGPPAVIFQKKKKKTSSDDDDEVMMYASNNKEQESDEQVQVEEQVLPDVEGRVLEKEKEKEKEVLIEIHCVKENGIELKILEELENVHHLSVTGSSVLPFGNSTLGITIVAKMPHDTTITLPHLLTNLRQLLLSSTHTTHHHDPY